MRLLQTWRYEWLLAHTLKQDQGKIPEPVLVRRPWEETGAAPDGEPERPRMSTRDEIRAFFRGESTQVVVSAS